jgi:hypothetical protein
MFCCIFSYCFPLYLVSLLYLAPACAWISECNNNDSVINNNISRFILDLDVGCYKQRLQNIVTQLVNSRIKSLTHVPFNFTVRLNWLIWSNILSPHQIQIFSLFFGNSLSPLYSVHTMHIIYHDRFGNEKT